MRLKALVQRCETQLVAMSLLLKQLLKLRPDLFDLARDLSNVLLCG